ncbi:Serine threonine-kinase CTR1 isoform A [Micractinium conductrix]|uniref:Serine threonine-kinase CTR1 isoform A n=1 Tax=Micractinium conductrix TaxID=554055 RepID=A0A2P6VIH3_9CHLO|nr:Serine threonine-kinase CTR1 isoform A [Micractinium conductrix]|eukprot:PSC73896.1 Serine threonine-kinase CTR1 isoform A [Micractinium conductrix]
MATTSPFAGTAPVGAGPAPPLAYDGSDGASTATAGDSIISPARSAQHSEAALLARCTAAVEQCRRDLEELRTAVKAATSHREKCVEVLGAAHEAVVALEDMLYDEQIDLRRERALQQLAGRVQNAMDQGEAVVKVYGAASGIMKLASKMCSPGTPLKFDAFISELTSLAKQARLAREQPPTSALPVGRLLSAGPSVAMDGMLGSSLASSPQNTMGPSSSGALSTSSQVPVPTRSGPVAAPSGPGAGLLASRDQPSGAPSSGGIAAGENGAAPSLATASAGAGSGSAVQWGDRTVPEEAMQETRVHKGGRGQAITGMVHVPPLDDRPGHLGHLWYYLSKSFGASSLVVWDLSAKVESEIKEARQGSTITCMHYDDLTGTIWSGHRNGTVRVWSAAKQESLCEPFRAFRAQVNAITTDENGFCWAASDKDKVRSFRLASQSAGGVEVGFAVVLRGELSTVGTGVPSPNYRLDGELNAEGMFRHPLARESAHYGPVRSLAAAEGRVWTCGGSSAFASFKEWSQDGVLMSSTNMQSMGLANDMILVSQVVIASESRKMAGAPITGSGGSGGPSGGSAALSSFTQATSVQLASRVAVSQLVELEMPWQLLTAHDNGQVQVWGHVSGRLRPLMRLGDRCAPALRVMVCEPLGALVTAHNDGKLHLRAIPYPRSPEGLNMTYQENSASRVSDDTLPAGLLETSKTGLANSLGGVLGVLTASNYGTIKHFPSAELRRVGEEVGVRLLGAVAAADPTQWPAQRLSPGTLRQLQAMAEQQQQHYSASLDEEGHMTERDTAGDAQAAERVSALLSDNSWLIEWSELSRTKIIGEGAFGKVWLGRWQETDVAIKQLSSLSDLGVEAGSLQHDSSGGIKMDLDVQRALDKEVGLLKNMRHPNIILFMGVVLEPPAVVTEYCARGSLYDLLTAARSSAAMAKALDWPRRIVMALDAAKGMLYLHGHKPTAIIHRDLKSPNLLVMKNWQVKVTDFNLSRQTKAAGETNSVQSMVANNPRWQPPEVILSQQYGKESDVYAYGLILWELLTWELPFLDLSNFQIMLAVTQQGQRPAIKDQWGAAQYPGGTFIGYNEYVALMQRCWADDPAARPTFEQIIADLRRIAKIVTDARAAAPVARGSGGQLLPLPSMARTRTIGRSTPTQLAAPPPVPPPVQSQAPAGQHAGQQPPVAVPSPFDAAYTPHVAAAAVAAGAAAAAAAAGASALQQQHGQQAGGGVVSSAPPPSPFDSAPAGAAVVSNGAIPAGPFGGGPAPWLQQAGSTSVSSAAAPPPSPFADAPSGSTISSAAPPPPSPFADVPSGSTISSAAPPPPSPFADAPSGSTISSAAPPPPSPFSGMPTGASISSAAPPPLSPFAGGFAHAAAAAAAGAAPPRSSSPTPSPYNTHIPSDSIPSDYGRQHLDVSAMPSAVLEASPSEEASAGAGGGAATGNFDSGGKSSGGTSRGESNLTDSALSGGYVPARISGSGDGGGNAGDASGGDGEQRQSLSHKLRKSISGKRGKLQRINTL